MQTPLFRVEHALLGPVTVLIVPLFALANASVNVRGALIGATADPVTWSTLLGVRIGEPAGVPAASWLAVASGMASHAYARRPRVRGEHQAAND